MLSRETKMDEGCNIPRKINLFLFKVFYQNFSASVSCAYRRSQSKEVIGLVEANPSALGYIFYNIAGRNGFQLSRDVPT